MQDERRAIEAEAAKLLEYAAKLQAQSAEMADSNAELASNQRDMVCAQASMSKDLAACRQQAQQLEESKRMLTDTKKVGRRAGGRAGGGWMDFQWKAVGKGGREGYRLYPPLPCPPHPLQPPASAFSAAHTASAPATLAFFASCPPLPSTTVPAPPPPPR